MPQPTRQELLDAVNAVLQTIDPQADVQTIRRTADAAYASYVFGLIIRAASLIAEPGSVGLRSIRGIGGNGAPYPFIVRGAPGYISSVAHDYGYAVFQCNSREYEVHLGVQYFGSSRVLHEFDISIIDSVDAGLARTNNRSPSSGKAKIVFECKFYGGNLGLDLGREFVGLIADFSSAKSARLVTNSGSGSVRNYLTERVKLKVNDHLSPGSPEETLFINAVADDMRNRLR